MLDKNNSILWDEYRKSKHLYENETLQHFTLSLAMRSAIDKFLELHTNFDGKKELYAIKGMVYSNDEENQPYAAAFNNDIETTMGLVRPKIRSVLEENSADTMALILYAMTGMFLNLSPEESSEQHHILLTLLQYETMGIDVSDCAHLWGHFAYTLEFESSYDANQVDGKQITPIKFKTKYTAAGFLSGSAQNVVAEFVFMNMSNGDKDWMALFAENPLLAAGILSIKNGITEDSWKLFNQTDNGEPELAALESYKRYRDTILSDITKAIDDLTNSAVLAMTILGDSFIRRLMMAGLLCLKICDNRELDGTAQALLNMCIKNLEETDSFPEGASLEMVLASLHRDMNLPELYFLFFTVFYAVDYGDFRSLAKRTFEQYRVQ